MAIIIPTSSQPVFCDLPVPISQNSLMAIQLFPFIEALLQTTPTLQKLFPRLNIVRRK
jgi:hypothetical protein